MRKKKLSKSAVDYRLAMPTAAKRCGNCVMFSNGKCTLVIGKIEKDHVCDRWAKK